MNLKTRKVRALGLCSGGLDSMLAGMVLKDQGIAVEWVSFETPFFAADKAIKASRITGIPLIVENITPDYLKMLKNPNCGYGKNMNPCLDCHALMFRMAGKIMQAKGFDFLFSGEVAGQRPMSQTKSSMRYVEKSSGFAGYILRPLSAQKLPETLSEHQGLVDRSRLLGITGRGRKDQIRLAEHYGITDYPAPAGGCLLTDKGYSRRLKDLFDHHRDPEAGHTENELHLLKYGRHFRLNPHAKIIVGRTRKDNGQILALTDPAVDIVIKTKDIPGPVAVMPRGGSREMIILAAEICTGYSKAPKGTRAEVNVTTHTGRETIRVTGKTPAEVSGLLL